MARGLHQVGSLGSGNHFLEIQVVDEVSDPKTARAFGLSLSQVCVMIHCGSRGLGHQICSEHVRTMLEAMARYRIEVPDTQLACAPVRSAEGEAYLAAMAAAANYGRANRQALTVATRDAFEASVGTGDLRLLYDVSHNLAKLEDHVVDGSRRLLCVHRKGATRALPPGHPDLPEDLRAVGQPVLVPGSMGTASHVLVGVDPGRRVLLDVPWCRSDDEPPRRSPPDPGRGSPPPVRGAGHRGASASARGLAEEAPSAYKDVDEVVAVSERAGLARRVVRLRPLGVLKG